MYLKNKMQIKLKSTEFPFIISFINFNIVF